MRCGGIRPGTPTPTAVPNRGTSTAPGGPSTYRHTVGSRSIRRGASRVPTVNRRARRILADVAKAAGPTVPPVGPAGPLFTEPVLVVSQKAKLIEVHNEYAIHDGRGIQIGAVREVGLNTAKKLLRAFTRLDTLLEHTYQIVDMTGAPVLVLSHPSEPFRAGILVEDGSGQEVGRIIQENMVGRIRFRLKAYGRGVVGSLNAENWRAWNFNIQDEHGTEVARITKTWEGLAKAVLTTADNYVVKIAPGVEQPFRTLVVASAVCIDSALKQESG